MRKHFLLLPILLIAAAFPLAGCGGGNSDEDQITDVIETTATTTSDENCTDLETQRFVEQTEFESGKDAIEQCKASGPESNADSVDVSNVEVDGDKATANAAITGSAFDGQTLAISLVKEDDQWKMDHIDAFVDFDQKKLAAAFAKAAQEGENPASPAQADCLARKLASAPPETAQQSILSGDSQQLVSLFGSCFG